MKLYKRLYNKAAMFLMAPVLLFSMASCGSYQYAGYNDDGIYGNTNNEPAAYENRVPENQEVYTDESSAYYKNYFAEKSAQYESVPTQGAIFTNVDNYTSNSDTIENNQESYYRNEYNEEESYGPWGSEASSVSINYYTNYTYPRFYYPSWNWNYGYAYSPYWGGYYNSFGWSIGFGYSPFYYSSYYHPHHYYYPYGYNSYYSGYNNYPYARKRNVAYNVGRRNSLSNSYYNSNRAANINARNTNISRNQRAIRNENYNASRDIRNNNSNVRTRVNVNPTRSRPNAIIQSNRSNRTNTNTTIRDTRSSRSNNDSYNRSNSRSNNNVRPTTTPRRSSGTISRGSSGSSRSSGTRSSSRRGSR